MTTKFNQEFYARIKAKKNESLSSIGQRRLMVVEKEKEKEVTKKEIAPCTKKRKTGDEGKEKVGPVSGGR